jgi:thiol-disulfide isomerase/thioredoxin
VGACTLALCLTSAVAFGGGELRTISGAPFSLSELLAQGPAVLVFWNSWLPHSEEFAKLIPEVAATAKRNGWQAVVVVFQEENADAPRTLLGVGSDLPVVLDRRGELVRRFKVTRAPTVLLVEKDGQVRARSGPDPAQVREVLRTMAAK